MEGAIMTQEVDPQVKPQVIEGEQEVFSITPTVLRCMRAGGKDGKPGAGRIAYNVGGGADYWFNSPNAETLILRDDHIRILLALYGPKGTKSPGSLAVVPEKEWPVKFVEKVRELRKAREAERARLFPEFKGKG